MTNRIANQQTQSPTQDGRMEVVMFKENDVWIAQGLQIDIACQHKDVQELMNIFARTVVGHVCLSLENSVDPFSTLKPAPDEYWQKYRLGVELRQVLTLKYSKEDQKKINLPASRIPSEATVRVS